MDYKELIDNLDDEKIISLMKNLGADRYVEQENCIIFPTICHHANEAEASMKLYYYKDTKLFVCWTECGKMSIFNFLKHYYETRNIEYNWFDDIVEVVRSCSRYKIFTQDELRYKSIRNNYANKKNRRELTSIPKGILDVFTKTYPVEWLKDGITKETMDKFNIKYSIPQNKIIIPHYDANGNLVGIRGRALDPWEAENIGKYMPIQIENKWYSHSLSLNLYGFNITKENIKKYGVCYVGESEKFVLQSESFSIPNCSVAICGSNFNKYQLDLLLRYAQPKEIIICFDKEEKKGETKYFNKLFEICKKYKNYGNFSFVYDRKNLLNLKDSPTDRGENIFKQLIDTRIRV